MEEMGNIETLILGAGQEVGKSCVVVSINGKRIMFDCGMHMGHNDHLRYPDFCRICEPGGFDDAIACVIITHFHMDHVGALPYFTEVCGYNGPIYMTYPTKALSPFMLEDNWNVMFNQKGEPEQFTKDHIKACMKKVVAVDLKQTVQVDKDLQIRAYYAGHVLGAAMFYAKVGHSAIVYTGDYNMTPERHLGAAQIDRLQLDLVITESTFAANVRDSKYAREREFLKVVHKCVAGGGKVLIPTFALGRAQELCMLLDDYWKLMNLNIPIYFSAGLTNQANMYYKMLISWTSQKVKESYATHNAFDFKNVRSFDRPLDSPGPFVLFATPGMLNGGFSLEVFNQWAPFKENLVCFSGYCLPGTVGHKLTSGKNTQGNVCCQIHQLSFSAHTDGKGIMDLIKFLSPKHVILVHGEKPNMEKLEGKIKSELGISCCHPANNETVRICSTNYVKAGVSETFAQSSLKPNFQFSECSPDGSHNSNDRDACATSFLQVSDERVTDGFLFEEKSKKAKVLHQDEILQMLGEERNEVNFTHCCPVHSSSLGITKNTDIAPKSNTVSISDEKSWLQILCAKLSSELVGANIQNFVQYLQVESFHVSVCSKASCPHRFVNQYPRGSDAVYFCCSWSVADEKLAWKAISVMQALS